MQRPYDVATGDLAPRLHPRQQMLESMISRSHPTRAEPSDVANAILAYPPNEEVCRRLTSTRHRWSSQAPQHKLHG